MDERMDRGMLDVCHVRLLWVRVSLNLYSRSLAVNSALAPEELRARIRYMVEQRLLPQATQFRLRNIAG